MIKKIDHIAFAVNNLNSSAKLFEKLFNVKSSKTAKRITRHWRFICVTYLASARGRAAFAAKWQ